MNVAAGPRLVAAVTNAGMSSTWKVVQSLTITPNLRIGGIGVIGAFNYSPRILGEAIDDLRTQLDDKDAPFGVDFAIPQVGGGARKTNVRPSNLLVSYCIALINGLGIHQYDYTKGQLSELTDVMIEKKVSLFVCAIGVPPKDMVDKLHAAGIVVMKWV
jgi:NAD(P)H-dependent flavin oxidoreductase YrpB (nitropropane dioxygenase family)